MSDQVPDVIGTVRGYRVWTWTGHHLYSTFHAEYEWGPWVNVATCDRDWWYRPLHPAPGTTCGCGLYAMYKPLTPWSPRHVTGVVEAWGTIELHDDGMRAERAKIVALCAYYRTTRRQLTAHFPNVKIYKTTAAMARDYPPASEICGIQVPEEPLLPNPFPRIFQFHRFVWAVMLFAWIIVLLSEIKVPNPFTTFVLVFWSALLVGDYMTTRHFRR